MPRAYTLPPPTADEAGIFRYWDTSRACYVAKVLPGQYYVSRSDLIVTVVGSCVAACMRDPVAGIGGVNHFMLPGHASDPLRDAGGAARYGAFAMRALIDRIVSGGGERRRLEVKLAGGGRVLEGYDDIGARNAAFARDFLHAEGLTIAAEDLGGPWPRRIYFDPRTGRLQVKQLTAQESAA